MPNFTYGNWEDFRGLVRQLAGLNCFNIQFSCSRHRILESELLIFLWVVLFVLSYFRHQWVRSEIIILSSLNIMFCIIIMKSIIMIIFVLSPISMIPEFNHRVYVWFELRIRKYFPGRYITRGISPIMSDGSHKLSRKFRTWNAWRWRNSGVY